MDSIQMELGNSTEESIANYIFNFGYCVYIYPKKTGGQPFDMWAIKSDRSIGLDAKHLEASKKSFSFDRVEPNQETSMWMAKLHAHIDPEKNLGFAIQSEIDPLRPYFLSYDRYIKMKSQGAKSVELEALPRLEDIL